MTAALALVTPPASEPVTLAEAKGHLRVSHDDEDAGILDMIRTAVRRMDGPSGALGRCLLSQRWRLTLDRFAGDIALPLPPTISVDRVFRLDAAGGEVTLAPASYRVTGLGTLDGARIRPARGLDWPGTFDVDSAFIEFTAGFGTDAADVPDPLRSAILMHVAHLYEHRESVIAGTGFIMPTPLGYEDLIRDYRVWSF